MATADSTTAASAAASPDTESFRLEGNQRESLGAGAARPFADAPLPALHQEARNPVIAATDLIQSELLVTGANAGNRRLIPMAMLPNDGHPGPGCSCRDCLARYPEEFPADAVEQPLDAGVSS